jgi:hypothetical protein
MNFRKRGNRPPMTKRDSALELLYAALERARPR